MMESADGGGNMRSSMTPDEVLAPDAAKTATTAAELPECQPQDVLVITSYLRNLWIVVNF